MSQISKGINQAQVTMEFAYLFNTEEEFKTCLKLLKKLKNQPHNKIDGVNRYPWPILEPMGVSLFAIDNEPFLTEESKTVFLNDYFIKYNYQYPFSTEPLKYKAGIKFILDLNDKLDMSFNVCGDDYECVPARDEAMWSEHLHIWQCISPCVNTTHMIPYERHNIAFHDEDCVVEFPPIEEKGEVIRVLFKKGDIQLAVPYERKNTIDDLLTRYAQQEYKDERIESFLKKHNLNLKKK